MYIIDYILPFDSTVTSDLFAVFPENEMEWCVILCQTQNHSIIVNTTGFPRSYKYSEIIKNKWYMFYNS